MLNVNHYEQPVSARLLGFMGTITPWHRGLWTPGTVLSRKEVLQASEAVQAGVLSDGSFRNLVAGTLASIGPDPGIGANQRRDAHRGALQSPIHANRAGYHQIKLLLRDFEMRDFESDYLANWAIALRRPNPP